MVRSNQRRRLKPKRPNRRTVSKWYAMYLLRWGEHHLYEGDRLEEEELWMGEMAEGYSDYIDVWFLLHHYGDELRGHKYGDE